MKDERRILDIYEMKKEIIYLTDELKKKIMAKAASEYPFEYCGILFGNERMGNVVEICDHVGMENCRLFADKNCHFCMDPLKIYEYEERYRDKGIDVMGFVHSHPDAPAVLSREDETDMIPGMIYMILEFDKGKCSDIRFFKKDSMESNVKEII